MTEPGDMDVSTRPRRGLALIERISTIWLVPLGALILALVIAWSAYSSRGPLIEVSFSNADGIVAGTTPLKFREVDVGRVERLRFSDGLSKVIVSIRIDRDVASYVDSESMFWIVRPEVTARGVSGLSTVLSGVYIQGDWDATEGETARSFEGLDGTPLYLRGEEGIAITLRTPNVGRLLVGAPIIYKGITVGHMGDPNLDENGTSVVTEAFIRAPYDQFVNTATRFWNASAFSISLGTGGLSFDVGSLAALIEGGVAFSNILSGGQPIDSGHVFDVYADDSAARSSIFDAPDAPSHPYMILFDDSISGLTVDAPVEYRGLRVGSVSSLGATVVGEGDDKQVEMRVQIGIQPQRLGLQADASAEDTNAFLASQVEQGLRARLASEGILRSSLKIELTELPDAAPAALDTDTEPPSIPSAPAEVDDIAVSAEGVLARIRNLPIEGIVSQVSDMLGNINRVLSSPAVQEAPQSALALIDDARNLVGSQAVADLVTQASAVVTDLRGMLDRIDESAAISVFLQTLEHVESVAGSVDTAASGLPELVQNIQDLAEQAKSLPLPELVNAATNLVQTADGLIGSDATAQLPAALTAALDELSLALAELREGGAVQNVNETLASTRAAAASIDRAAERLPELSARLDVLTRDAASVLTAYGSNSQFNQQTLAALRDLRDAARAATALARTLERNPDALIRGR